jgi:polyferredoxin
MFLKTRIIAIIEENRRKVCLMQGFKRHIIIFLVILGFGSIPAIVLQFFLPRPVSRYIHIRNFRYGKDPSVIRCNRGDTLHLTFSTDDTGHSFYLEEFDVDAKVSPAREMVEVFKVSDPTDKPYLTRELVIVARHPGILNFLVSRSNFRCHVWCGPMHAFEHGKLIIRPNTLLVFSMGCLFGILVIWMIGLFQKISPSNGYEDDKAGYRDIMKKPGLLQKLVIPRWPQTILVMIAMALMYVVVLTSIFGTKMSGRNLGVLMMWAIWLFLLVAIITPLLGRFWCTICPLPFFGDLIQRRSLIAKPDDNKPGTREKYRNRFNGLSIQWPIWLRNGWARLVLLLILTTFSNTLVAVPKITGIAVIVLVLLPTTMALVFELRAFCRYLCPVSVFVGTFSRMSPVALRNKSQHICDNCKTHYCQKGSQKGWACPYGLNVGEMKENTDCGLCLECTRSCLYNNITLYTRPFGTELGTRNWSEAWVIIGVFVLAIVYSVLYQGHWPVVRDYVNILDKGNWGLFGIYFIIVWTLALIVMPGLLFALCWIGARLSKVRISLKKVFLDSAGTLLPLGLILWIAFVIPMFFVNVTFIKQSISDPFGWGWDFLGTANIPWHQFIPRAVPWLQAILVLTGLHLSLRNLKRTWINNQINSRQLFRLSLPVGLFLTCSACGMIFFFTN